VGLRETIVGAFSFLGIHTQSEDRIAAYVIREHRRGRALAEILQDNYVTNRCTAQQIQRVLDRPDVLHAIGDDTVAAARATI
jgi:hypothetical protein